MIACSVIADDEASFHRAAPSLHRQARPGAIERLDLAPFIARQNDGTVRRIDIEADDVAQLGNEQGAKINMLLPTIPIRDDSLQRGSLAGIQCNLGSFVHSPGSHDRIRRGILKRIEM